MYYHAAGGAEGDGELYAQLDVNSTATLAYVAALPLATLASFALMYGVAAARESILGCAARRLLRRRLCVPCSSSAAAAAAAAADEALPPPPLLSKAAAAGGAGFSSTSNAADGALDAREYSGVDVETGSFRQRETTLAAAAGSRRPPPPPRRAVAAAVAVVGSAPGCAASLPGYQADSRIDARTDSAYEEPRHCFKTDVGVTQ